MRCESPTYRGKATKDSEDIDKKKQKNKIDTQ